MNYKDDTQNHQNNSEEKIHTRETIQHKTTTREAERKADRSEKEEGEENNTRRDERSNQEDKEQGRIVEHKRGNDINQAEQLIRKNTLLGKIGLAEYNPNKKIWECRIDECEAEIDTTKKISPRRKKHHHEHYFRPNAQETTCPYCIKTMNAIGRLFIHLEIQSQ